MEPAGAARHRREGRRPSDRERVSQTPYNISLLGPESYIAYLERGSAFHLASGTQKSCVREIAIVGSEPIFHIVKTNTLGTGGEIHAYAELQRQIHDALRVEHPEWVKPNGDCPTCESYESRLAELLGLSSAEQDRQVA
jgi:hypothetical protein